jgi:copper homeostasis protein
VRDPDESLATLIELGAARLLTSGLERTALEGLDLITHLVELGGERILVMPGGGINERNAEKILRTSRAREFHVSASSVRESRMVFRNTRVAMGRQMGPPEYQFSVASPDRVRSFAALTGGL